MNDIAGIGHNLASPFDLSFEEIDGLFLEAKNWLDGKGVHSEADATGVSKLLDAARSAEKIATAAKKVEQHPHDEAVSAVREKWRPLLTKAELIQTTCKAALKPWLEKVDAEKKAIAEKTRREAKAKMEVAADAIRKAHLDEGNLAERETAEIMLATAKRSEAAATRAENDKAQAKGGSRAVGLRSTWRPYLTDGVAAARNYWLTRRPEMETYLTSLAETDVRSGKREIPGFEVKEEKQAV